MSIVIFWGLVFAQECEDKCRREVFDRLDDRISRIGPNSFTSMSVELVKKEEELKARELQLKKKEEELQLLQDGLGKKIADFNKQQERLISCINVNKEEEDKRIKQVVEIISNMKPDAAAKLLNIQDETIAIKVLAFLPPVKVAKIFNLMDAEISAKLQKQYMTMLK